MIHLFSFQKSITITSNSTRCLLKKVTPNTLTSVWKFSWEFKSGKVQPFSQKLSGFSLRSTFFLSTQCNCSRVRWMKQQHLCVASADNCQVIRFELLSSLKNLSHSWRQSSVAESQFEEGAFFVMLFMTEILPVKGQFSFTDDALSFSSLRSQLLSFSFFDTFN